MSAVVTSASDIEDISRLLARAFAQLEAFYSPEILNPVMPYFSTCQPTLVASGQYFALRQDGVIRAVGGWTAQAPGTDQVISGHGHIRHVAVDPDAGRRGLGRALLGAIEADAARAGITELEAFSNLPAVPFYRSLGYNEVGPRTGMIAGAHPFPGVDLLKRL